MTRSKVKVTSPSKLEVRPFSTAISCAICSGSWQLTMDLVYFLIFGVVFCHIPLKLAETSVVKSRPSVLFRANLFTYTFCKLLHTTLKCMASARQLGCIVCCNIYSSACHSNHNMRTYMYISNSPSLPAGSFWVMMIVWRFGEKIRTVMYCIVYDSCAQWYVHTCEQFFNLCETFHQINNLIPISYFIQPKNIPVLSTFRSPTWDLHLTDFCFWH